MKLTWNKCEADAEQVKQSRGVHETDVKHTQSRREAYTEQT